MKKEDIESAVREVVLDVFENMYFMFPEAVSEDEPLIAPADSYFKAEVALENGTGVFVFYGSDQLVANMAENLLGPEQTTAEGDLIDVFKEAANVIAGNLLTRLALAGSVALGIPEAERSQTWSELCTAPGVRELIFNVDNEFFKAAVVIADR
jgi:hypothetical protein